MRVNIDLDESVLNKLGEMAKAGKRNRKNYMEYILESATEKGNLVWADEKKDKVIFQPSEEGKYSLANPDNRKNIAAMDEVGQWQEEPIKDYAFYEDAAKKVKFDDAENLIIEIMASTIKSWQKPILQKMINARFPQP